MPNLGPLEIAIIAGIVVLLFGVGRISGLGRELGSSIREFRRGVREEKEEEGEEASASAAAPAQAQVQAPPPPPAAPQQQAPPPPTQAAPPAAPPAEQPASGDGSRNVF